MDEEHRKTESCLHDILRPLRVILLEQVFSVVSHSLLIINWFDMLFILYTLFIYRDNTLFIYSDASLLNLVLHIACERDDVKYLVEVLTISEVAIEYFVRDASFELNLDIESPA